MKLNLALGNQGDHRSGYINVDTITIGDCQLHNLDPVVDDGEAEEIIAHDVLDFYPGQQVDAVLEHWIKKLRHGGQLTVSALDLREAARAIWLGTLDLSNANDLVYGEQGQPHEFRKSALTMDVLVAFFEDRGLKVLKKRVINHRAIVTAERP